VGYRARRDPPDGLSTAGAARVATEGGDSYEQRVTPLELFFDLVFVFALTQVTGFLSHHLTWVGMLQGVALLAVLWWAWVGYSWLTNAVPAEDVIPARLVIFAGMAAMFVASLAVPDAFGEYGVIFGFAYLVVWLLQVLLYALATGREPEQRQAILRLAPGYVGAPALLIVAGFLDGYAQGALWAVALAIDYGVAVVRGVSGFRVHAGHFVERHGLIIIIALGESIVAAGVGASGLALGVGVLVAVVSRDRARRSPVVGVLRPHHAVCRAEALCGAGRGAGEAGARLLQLAAPTDGCRDNLRRPRHQADPGSRRGSPRAGPGGRAVRGRRPLPPRAQCLQAARRGQRERSQVGGHDPLLRPHPRGDVCALPDHPRRPSVAYVRAGHVRDGDLTRVPAPAPSTIEATEYSVCTKCQEDVFSEVRQQGVLRPLPVRSSR
jgi:hypothetical protein